MLQCKEYLNKLDHNVKWLPLHKQLNKATLAYSCLNMLEDEVAHHAVATYIVSFSKKTSHWIYYWRARVDLIMDASQNIVFCVVIIFTI